MSEQEQLTLFLPCAHGVEPLLLAEVQATLNQLASASDRQIKFQETALAARTGVRVQGNWTTVLALNLHTRLAQRVLIRLAQAKYSNEDNIYEIARRIPWSDWFSVKHSFKVDVTAQHSPLKSLRFAGLKVKDAVVDRFRNEKGARPDVNTYQPDVRLYLHLEQSMATLYIDTSGEPLFKRGWRTETGEAPLKETLAAAMLAASGWQAQMPLYDPCCGSGTIAIEAAQIACRLPPGHQRAFAFEKLLPCQSPTQQRVWQDVRQTALAQVRPSPVPIFGSDVAHRMVDFASNNARLAGVADAVVWRGGDARQRLPPCESVGTLMFNPPYGERIGIQGFGTHARGRQEDESEAWHEADPDLDPQGATFFSDLAAHWKKNYVGWSAWILSPQAELPSLLRLKPTRRVPLWNGPIECRLFRFDLVQGRMSR
jgi:putative N6-adenine-specific DNA methylase